MDLKKKSLKKSSSPIVEFPGESVLAEGKITLPVTITDEERVTITVPQEFYIVDAPTRYNCILGRKLTEPTFHLFTIKLFFSSGEMEE